jgi:hypothetical protein
VRVPSAVSVPTSVVFGRFDVAIVVPVVKPSTPGKSTQVLVAVSDDQSCVYGNVEIFALTLALATGAVSSWAPATARATAAVADTARRNESIKISFESTHRQPAASRLSSRSHQERRWLAAVAHPGTVIAKDRK